MTRKQIWSVIRKLDYTLDDNTVETMTDDIYIIRFCRIYMIFQVIIAKYIHNRIKKEKSILMISYLLKMFCVTI
jgi:hypothetical protein